MTWRAMTVGLLAAIAIAALSYYNDWVLELRWLVANHLPVVVFAPLILLVAAGGLLGRWRAALALTRGEWATIIALALVGCGLGGAGLFRNFPIVLSAPLQLAPHEIAWQRTGALEATPAPLLPAVRPGDDAYTRTIGRLPAGLAKGRRNPAPVTALPWRPWRRTLLWWAGLIVLLTGAMLAMAAVVHRQWAHHELLPYPIAEFAGAILAAQPGRAPPVFRRPGFLWAGGAVVALHLLNGYHAWQPTALHVPMWLDLSMLREKLPWLTEAVGGWDLMYPELYISAAAFVFFMRSDASFSMGVSTIAMACVSGALIERGVDFAGNQAAGGLLPWLSFGSYLGATLVIVYTGRRFYARVLRGAAGLLAPGRETPAYAVWAARVLLVCLAGATAMLIGVGVPWPVAVAAVVVSMMLVLVVGRISAETGLFHIGLIWSPLAVVLGLFGPVAAGPAALAAVGLLGGALLMDPREALLPFALNGLRLGERSDLRPGRLSAAMGATLVIALLIALPVVMWTQYNFGLGEDHRSRQEIPHIVYDTIAGKIDTMNVQGELAPARRMTGWQRLGAMRPEPGFLGAVGIGAGAVLLCGAARLRWPKWPIHPVLFLVWGTWAMQKLAPSILLGWLIRTIVVRIGGSQKLIAARPIVIGCIAGDLVGTLVWMIVGLAYALLTGNPPPTYNPYTG